MEELQRTQKFSELKDGKIALDCPVCEPKPMNLP